MAINQFANPKSKRVNNDPKFIIKRIAKTYNIEDRTYKMDKKNIIISKMRYFEKRKFF